MSNSKPGLEPDLKLLASKPIVYTCGEPSGIGVDLAVLAAKQGLLSSHTSAASSPYLVIGNEHTIRERAAALGVPLIIRKVADYSFLETAPSYLVENGVQKTLDNGQFSNDACGASLRTCFEKVSAWIDRISQSDPKLSDACKDTVINLINVPVAKPVHAAKLCTANASHVIGMLHLAAKGALSDLFSAVVTGPVHKSVLVDAGYEFSGHTEFFQKQAGVDRVVMMLAGGDLRVALASTHLPLRDVADYITADRLTEVVTILVRDLQDKFGIERPRILVAGLNPHAGEDGHLGREELDIIIPTLEQLRTHINAELIGPLPADTLFTNKYLKDADAVLAMYHDQGLPVLKYQSFGNGANITLGLPFIRTSVDHGTALDLAGTGSIDTGSLKEAVKVAHAMRRAAKG